MGKYYIVESKIAKSLGVSQGSVREVLRTLAEQGVVENIPFKGSFVVSLSREDLEQIIEVRLLLESLAITLARKRVTKHDLQDLQELVKGMGKASDVHEFGDLHHRFHSRLWAISQNRQLVRILDYLTSSLFAFHRVYLYPENKPMRYRVATHQTLVKELRGRTDPLKLAGEHMVEIMTWLKTDGETRFD